MQEKLPTWARLALCATGTLLLAILGWIVADVTVRAAALENRTNALEQKTAAQSVECRDLRDDVKYIRQQVDTLVGRTIGTADKHR
ncbi:MAG: hypothetical protein ABSE73_25315 [Planctomycetota bacterium]